MGDVVLLHSPKAEDVLALAIGAHLGPREHPGDDAADYAFAQAAVKLLREAGLVVVPLRATREMLRAGDQVWCDVGDAAGTWNAMVEAALQGR